MNVWKDITGETKLTDEDRRRNRMARERFRLKEVIDSLGEDIVRRVHAITHAPCLTEGDPGYSIRRKSLAAIRRTGYKPLEHYSGMNSYQMKLYLDRLATDTEAMMKILDERKYVHADESTGTGLENVVQAELEMPNGRALPLQTELDLGSTDYGF